MSDELYEGTARPLENYAMWQQVSPPTPVPIDWPARFEVAGEVADRLGDGRLGLALQALADALADRDRLSPHDVELLGRALLGEES